MNIDEKWWLVDYDCRATACTTVFAILVHFFLYLVMLDRYSIHAVSCCSMQWLQSHTVFIDNYGTTIKMGAHSLAKYTGVLAAYALSVADLMILDDWHLGRYDNNQRHYQSQSPLNSAYLFSDHGVVCGYWICFNVNLFANDEAVLMNSI